jgi:PAS domain S-box-containing protein
LLKHEVEETRLGAIFSASPEAITISNLNGKIIECNQATLVLHGFSSKEELIGKSASKFIAKKDHKRARENLKKTLEQGPLRHKEYTFLTKDGHEFCAESSASVVKDASGNPMGFVTITKDITERKHMEEELRHNERKIRVLFENLPQKIFYKNNNSVYVSCNENYARDLKIKADEIVGKTDYDFHPKELAEKYRADDKRIMESGKTEEIEEGYIQDGQKRVVHTVKTPVKDENGNAVGVLGIFWDVTERKRMEEDLQRYSKHLEELVEERTRKLREAERFAAIGETAAMVGHDLRNPLQVITNMVYLGKEMVQSMPSPCRELAEKKGVYELFETVEKQMEYMNKIVSDLQDFAKPLKPEFVETSLHQLINETLSMVTIPENVKVSLVIDEDFPKLMVDHTLMKRVFINLITNALQAMPDGGQLIVRLSRTEEDAFISVQDTGVGIPKENLDKLFSPLFTTKSKGTGFGLSVCKRLVEAHSGSITVKSEVGRGSTFTVKLPLGKEVS